MNALTLGVFWMVYYALHSAMASEGFKAFFKKRLSTIYPYYRALYSFFAIVNFFLLFVLHDMAPDQPVYESGMRLTYFGFFLIVLGLVVLIRAGMSYGLSFLFREEREYKLITTGLNAYVRHPIYSGILLMLVGFFLAYPFLKNLVFSLISVLYLIVGSLLEEQKLIRIYGQEYLEYKRRVRMLIPGLF